jgi:DNA-binding GntR family transcriptional regulator
MSAAQRPPVRLPRLRQPARMSLVDFAYETIAEAIVDQAVEPGTPLRIDVLRAQLGMSSTPVREALVRAADQGLVSQDANRGFMVTPLLDAPGFHELYQTRRILELGALSVAGRPDREALARLRSIATRMRRMTHGRRFRDFIDFNRADRDFHRTLIGLSGNSLLLRTWSGLHFHLHVGRLYSGVGITDFSEAVGEHDAIVDALAAGHSGLVSRVATHIDGSEKRLAPLARHG